MAGKKSRKQKTSQGLVGAKKHPLSPLEKILLGKGLYQSPRLFPKDAKPKKETASR